MSANLLHHVPGLDSTDRVKTDRKDAELLARLLLAGQLTPVFVRRTGWKRCGTSRAGASRSAAT